MWAHRPGVIRDAMEWAFTRVNPSYWRSHVDAPAVGDAYHRYELQEPVEGGSQREEALELGLLFASTPRGSFEGAGFATAWYHRMSENGPMDA